MPVVDKIESLTHMMQTVLKKYMSGDYQFNITWYGKYNSTGRINESKIEAVRTEVVKFIKWYNSNKNENT